MPIILAIVGLLLLVLTFAPQVWIRRVLRKHGADRPDLPGTGAELARHLLDEADLQSVSVETTANPRASAGVLPAAAPPSGCPTAPFNPPPP